MFFIPAVMSALGFLASLRVEWRSVKDSGKVKGFRQGTESRARQIETNAALKDMEAVNGSEQLEKEDA